MPRTHLGSSASIAGNGGGKKTQLTYTGSISSKSKVSTVRDNGQKSQKQPKQRKRSYVDLANGSGDEESDIDNGENSADNSGNDNDMDNESEGYAGTKINQILQKLGTQFTQKIQAKKQKLDVDFKELKVGPSKLVEIQNRHDEERRKQFSEILETSKAMADRMTNIITLQDMIEEKFTKMVGALTKANERNRTVLEECIKAQSTIFEHFLADLKSLEENQNSATGILIHKCETVLKEIKEKVVKEAMKSETEALVKCKFF